MSVVRKQELNWKAKAIAFNVLDKIPRGEKVYYLLQRYVTKSIPRPLSPTSAVSAQIKAHVRALESAGGDLSKVRLFEFGAGWDLYSNLVLYCLGATEQWTMDVRRLARADAINSVIDHLKLDPPEGAVRVPEWRVGDSTLDEDLKRYGIRYLAPADARKTPFEDGFADFILTTSVLEHVPEVVLKPIIKECHRILKPDGIMSHIVDFSDHYSHTDREITNFNYLRYSEEEWKKYNPGIHYQNRLRKKDYLKIFDDAKFAVIDEQPWLEDPAVKVDFPIDASFAHLTEADIRELGAHFVLRAV